MDYGLYSDQLGDYPHLKVSGTPPFDSLARIIRNVVTCAFHIIITMVAFFMIVRLISLSSTWNVTQFVKHRS